MYLDFPTTTLLAGLPYLLTPPPVGEIAVRNDVVGASVAVAFGQQASFGVIHVSFVTRLGETQMHKQYCSLQTGRPFLQVNNQVETASIMLGGGYLIGDPRAPGDTLPRLRLPDRHASALLRRYEPLVVSRSSTRLQG